MQRVQELPKDEVCAMRRRAKEAYEMCFADMDRMLHCLLRVLQKRREEGRLQSGGGVAAGSGG